jgi:apolipoprotein D and lipocalin family protein
MATQASSRSTLFTALGRVKRRKANPLDVVPDVDYDRYAGQWFEVAKLPTRFERKCARNVTATYTRLANGQIEVTNQCTEATGRVRRVVGAARQVAKRPRSVLQVRFAPALLGFLPFVWGDYQIIELSPTYTYAVVGTPNRAYLWVLARTSTLSPGLYAKLLEGARRQGFDVRRVVKTMHAA